jgi:hypothetical protein
MTALTRRWLAILLAVIYGCTIPTKLLNQPEAFCAHDHWWMQSRYRTCPSESMIDWRKVSFSEVQSTCGGSGTVIACWIPNTCTIVSYHSQYEARDVYVSDESVYDHELRHALTGLVHPAGHDRC